MQNDLFGVLFGNNSGAKTAPEDDEKKDTVKGDVHEATEDIPCDGFGMLTGNPEEDDCYEPERQERLLPSDEPSQSVRDLQKDSHDDDNNGRGDDGGLPVLLPVLHPTDQPGEVRDVERGDEEEVRDGDNVGASDNRSVDEGEEGWFPRQTEDDRRLIESALKDSPWVKRLDSTIEWKFPWAPGIDEEQKNAYVVQLDSVVPRMGAKSKLREWLVRRFPAHHRYVEPFGGSFKVLLWKRNNSRIEIINDMDDDLIHFFRHVTFFPEKLCDMINTVPTSEKLLKVLKGQLKNRELTGLERAAAFFVVARLSFNGTGTSYAGSVHSLAMCSADKKDFINISRRLRRVDIRNTDCFKLIKQCNKVLEESKYPPGGVFFYLDPPYDETHGYSTASKKLSFGWDEQKKLYEHCVEIDEAGNKFIQTNSATDRLYELYSEKFNCIHRDVYYSVSKSTESRGDAKELIISNFDITKEQTASIGGLFSA